MSRPHIFPGVDEALNEIAVLTSNEKVVRLVQKSLSSISLRISFLQSSLQLSHQLHDGSTRLAVVDLDSRGVDLAQLLFAGNQASPPVSIILITENASAAQAAGVEIGGCVHHLFTFYPTPEHLRDFILRARDKQQRLHVQRSALRTPGVQKTPA